jgi:hypothetical protein
MSVVFRLILRIVLIRGTRSGGASRTLTWSSSITLRKLPEWLKGTLGEHKEWFNHSRFHRGIEAYPADLCKRNVRKFILQKNNAF